MTATASVNGTRLQYMTPAQPVQFGRKKVLASVLGVLLLGTGAALVTKYPQWQDAFTSSISAQPITALPEGDKHCLALVQKAAVNGLLLLKDQLDLRDLQQALDKSKQNNATVKDAQTLLDQFARALPEMEGKLVVGREQIGQLGTHQLNPAIFKQAVPPREYFLYRDAMAKIIQLTGTGHSHLEEYALIETAKRVLK